MAAAPLVSHTMPTLIVLPAAAAAAAAADWLVEQAVGREERHNKSLRFGNSVAGEILHVQQICASVPMASGLSSLTSQFLLQP